MIHITYFLGIFCFFCFVQLLRDGDLLHNVDRVHPHGDLDTVLDPLHHVVLHLDRVHVLHDIERTSVTRVLRLLTMETR